MIFLACPSWKPLLKHGISQLAIFDYRRVWGKNWWLSWSKKFLQKKLGQKNWEQQKGYSQSWPLSWRHGTPGASQAARAPWAGNAGAQGPGAGPAGLLGPTRRPQRFWYPQIIHGFYRCFPWFSYEINSSIWENWNNSLTWIKAKKGDDLSIKTVISSEVEEWGRYNLPISMRWILPWFCHEINDPAIGCGLSPFPRWTSLHFPECEENLDYLTSYSIVTNS